MGSEAQHAKMEAGDGVEKPSSRTKLRGRAFYESIGSPKFVLAPMVEQSEFVRHPDTYCLVYTNK
jgi:tRNA-dihydrouridine synthase 1